MLETFAMHRCIARIYYYSGIGYRSRKIHTKADDYKLNRVFRMWVELKNTGETPRKSKEVGFNFKIKISV